MKRNLTLFFTAVLSILGCNNEIINPADNIDGSILTAATEPFSGSSKTSLDADHNILWSKGDRIAIFMDSQKASEYEVTDATAGTTNGSFTLIGNQNGNAGHGKNVAFYPYKDGIECSQVNSAYVINSITLPQTQNYTEKSFENGSFLMATFSESHKLCFKNVFGALKLQFKGNITIKSIHLEGNNGEKISGNASVTVYTDGKAPAITMAANASGRLTLDCGDGVKLKTSKATTFILALPPATFSKGFTVTVTTSENKTMTLKTSSANDVARSSILSMPVRDLSASKHITFTESNEDIANPERGFYEARSTNGFPLEEIHIETARTNNRTLFHIGHTLPATSNISSDFLARLKKELGWLRDGGAKCILRFSYSDNTSKKPWDATPSQVLKHIEQLKPILQEYGDVILCFQAGFIGVWGEWYYTDNFDKDDSVKGDVDKETTADDDYEVRRSIIDAMLDAMPSDRTVAIRTPSYKKEMYAGSYSNVITEETAYNGSKLSRLSCFNDCFGADEYDQGTFDGNSSREYWKNETKYVFMGGETCAVSNYCKCDQSLKDMEDFHWSYLNNDYNTEVISRWESGSCLNEIKRRLGYRLSLTDVYHTSRPVAGQSFTVAITIKNSGFAAPMNGRGVELILVDGSGRKTVYDLSDEVDPRYWFAGGSYTFEKTIKLEADADGECTMYLNLPDPKEKLHDNPRFSIRLANANVWNKDTGYNKMFSFTALDKDSAADMISAEVNAAGENITVGGEFNPWGE